MAQHEKKSFALLVALEAVSSMQNPIVQVESDLEKFTFIRPKILHSCNFIRLDIQNEEKTNPTLFN